MDGNDGFVGGEGLEGQFAEVYAVESVGKVRTEGV